MRYFARCSYKGTPFNGWQRQPDTSTTVQESIEHAFSLITREKIQIVGCGRTDTGVHASEYYFHYDSDYTDIDHLRWKVNQIVPKTIFINQIFAVSEDAHARFDAVRRGYVYHVTKYRDPFRIDTAYTHPKLSDLSLDRLNTAASILVGKHSFDAFCKTGTDVHTKNCHIYESQWVETDDGFIYRVRADRFLRGMIRLIVGMCINVSRGKLPFKEVTEALQEGRRLSMDWSVPACGLFLDKVEYDRKIHELELDKGH